jgi:hypothetical protein
MVRLRLVLSFLGVAVILASTMPAAAVTRRALTPHPPVIATRAIELFPAADDTYVAWTANTNRRPNRFNVYFSQSGGPKQRVNPPGTQADTGGIDGTELIYSEFTPDGSDLVLYDLVGGAPIPLPDGVNTGRVELGPSNSGNFLLFERDRFGRRNTHQSIVLFNTMTPAATILAESDRKFLIAGQVNGDWVANYVCGNRSCNVFRYQISIDTTEKVPNPDNKPQYSASVTDAGVVFFVRSGFACGRNARYMSWDGGSPPALSHALRDGRDSLDSFVDDTASSLYFDRINCGREFNSDIFSEPIP